ncbi:MAG: gamma-glutamyltransferase [Pseudomonadota bacterium]|nr:gamma-glutamyltransferase [Pseudomonadota bacterium]
MHIAKSLWSLRVGIACSLLLSGCAVAPGLAERDTTTAPLAATANPFASRAALEMIERGGSAADAAVAAQMVLGLVEPQSSGLGGGTLALYWQADTRQLTSLDGLAAAPAHATAGLTVDVDGSVLAADVVRRGGRSVGVPGTLALWSQLHRQHGKLPWPALFEPAIALAEQGVPMPRYLHEVLAAVDPASVPAPMRALYFGADGKVLPEGATFRNPAYAATLRTIAAKGPVAWLEGGGARDIVAAAQGGAKPSLMTEGDVLAYRAEARAPVCGPFLRYRVCGTGPASFGGIAVVQMLQIVESSAGPSARYDFDDPAFVHRYVEAGRMAQADRFRYVGDPAFVDVPVEALVDATYLKDRAASIDPQNALKEIRAGVVARPSALRSSDFTEQADATSQMAIVDAAGNALSATTTINLNFGSWLMVDGFVLNDALTNFSAAPPAGQTRANQMAPGKRPVTSMTPTIVFDERGTPMLVGGSAGGGQIVDYVTMSLIEMLAAGQTPAEALAHGHVSTAVVGTVQLEQGTTAALLAPALQAQGHHVIVTKMKSGLAFLKRVAGAWIGAADPRRDGAVASTTH